MAIEGIIHHNVEIRDEQGNIGGGLLPRGEPAMSGDILLPRDNKEVSNGGPHLPQGETIMYGDILLT